MDIIILAALAAFIFYKLRQQLGQIDDEQKRDAIKKFIKEQADLKNQSNIKEINPNFSNSSEQQNGEQVGLIDLKSQKILDQTDPEIREELQKVLQEANISLSRFIEGAEKAFETILHSFAQGNLDVLKTLLSEPLYKNFAQVILARNQAGQKLTTQIVSINKSEILQAKISGGHLIILIKFYSQQINHLTDSRGETIEGDKSEINDMIDVWTFKKDINSKNPNWFIAATGQEPSSN